MVSSGEGGCVPTQVLVLEDVVGEDGEAFTLTWVYYDKVGVVFRRERVERSPTH